MKHLYGEFTKNQIEETKKKLRGSIFLLLLCVDPKTASNYDYINVDDYFESLMYKISGMNSLLLEQQKLVDVLILLQAAKDEFDKPHKEGNVNSENYDRKNYFNFKNYRKLILDAGSEVLELKEEV